MDVNIGMAFPIVESSENKKFISSMWQRPPYEQFDVVGTEGGEKTQPGLYAKTLKNANSQALTLGQPE